MICLDIESKSACDLKVAGAWRYSLHPTTDVYCAVLAMSMDGAPGFYCWEPGKPPPVFRGVAFLAHNCAFERAIWTNVLHPRYGWPPCPPPRQWQDTQAHAAAANLPITLEGLGAALGAPVQKDAEGHALMKKMSWLDPDGAPNPHDTPENRERLRVYCRRDVESTLSVWQRVPKMISTEQELWFLDQEINARGVYIDREFVARLSAMAEKRKAQLGYSAWFQSDGDLENSTSSPALKEWLKDQGVALPTVKRVRVTGEQHESESVGRQQVLELAADEELDPFVRSVLLNRLEASKATSLAKLAKVEQMIDPRDGRLRNSLQFCAAHTGRWSSRGLQVHNLPRDKRPREEVRRVRQLVEAGDLAGLHALVDRPLEALSQSLRGIVAASSGHNLIGADFAAIEARVIAWLAGQEDVLEALADPKRDLYVEDAAKSGSTDRQFGKTQRLGLNYQMGAKRFVGEAAKNKIKLTLKESALTVRTWRKNNAKIVAFWKTLANACRDAIRNRGVVYRAGEFLRVAATPTCLLVQLPSGRAIRYWQPQLERRTKRVEVVTEEGEIEYVEITSDEIQFFVPHRNGRDMEKEATYEGELAENITQGLARDLLGGALLRLDAAGYPPVIHVHDSIAAEVREGSGSVEEFCTIMAAVPAWAPGLPLKAEGYRSTRFQG